jgi:16S rRNA G966 N2-methylase RsmD
MLQRHLQEAMRRVVVLNADYRDYLCKALTKSVDVIYFDPFFEEMLQGATTTVGSLAAFGNPAPLDIRSIIEARRVAKRSVIIKHPKWQILPQEILSEVKEEVSGRKSSVTFAVIPPFGD